jgi:hypothetical protein
MKKASVEAMATKAIFCIFRRTGETSLDGVAARSGSAGPSASLRLTTVDVTVRTSSSRMTVLIWDGPGSSRDVVDGPAITTGGDMADRGEWYDRPRYSW